MATKKTETKKGEEVVSTPAPEVEAEEEAVDDIQVADPEILRPKELPLVVTSKKPWANEAQAEYARILNGYAYSNPTKWNQKKALLLKNLRLLAEQPGLLAVFKGGGDEAQKISYKNHITQPNQN